MFSRTPSSHFLPSPFSPFTFTTIQEVRTLFSSPGLLDRVLLSHDAGCFDSAKPGGGTSRPYDLMFTQFFPMLRGHGLTNDEVDQLLVVNPARAFAIERRPLQV